MEAIALALAVGSLMTIGVTITYLWLCWKKRLYGASMVALVGAVNVAVSGILQWFAGRDLWDVLFTFAIALIWLGTYAMTAWRYRKNLE